MALTKKLLKGIGSLTDEQIETIFEAHMETVNGLQKDIAAMTEKANAADQLKTERDKLQQQIDAAAGGTDWHAEYDKLKAATEARENETKVKAAYRKLLKSEKIDDDVLDAVMDATKFDGMKLDKDGNLQGADKLSEGIRSRWSKFVVTEGVKPTPTRTPPTGGKLNRTKEEIMSIRDTAERQQAIAENMELFQ